MLFGVVFCLVLFCLPYVYKDPVCNATIVDFDVYAICEGIVYAIHV